MIDLSPLLGRSTTNDEAPCSFRVFPRAGRERWLLDSHQQRPWHLKTWPRADFRARLIYNAAWSLGTMGVQLPSRVERYSVASGSVYSQLQERFDRLGVFLGTPGPNRKFVLYAGNINESFFVKVPISKASKVLVERETAALAELSTDPDLAGLVPAFQKLAGHLAMEDMERGGSRYAALGVQELVRFHALMFNRSKTTRSLSSLRTEWEGKASDNALIEHRPETKDLLRAAREAARHALDTMPQSLEIPCYMAHGDFTRWNVLRARDGTARVIDWELYGLKPRWFDVLHYIISHGLLVSRTATARLMEHVASQGTAIAGPGDQSAWRQHVTLYLACQCLLYGGVYERQRDLHLYPQALWQLKSWSQALHQVARKAPDHKKTR